MKYASHISVRLIINSSMHQVVYPGTDCGNLFNSNLRQHYKEMHFTTNGMTSWYLLTLLFKQAIPMEIGLWTLRRVLI